MPDFLTQVKEALGLPSAAPVAGPSPAVPAPVISSSVPPPIVVENSDTEADVLTLAVPFRSASSEAYLPMISTDDSWASDAEFRFVLTLFFLLSNQIDNDFILLQCLHIGHEVIPCFFYEPLK